MTGRWVPADTRDAIVDFVRRWATTAEIPRVCFVSWMRLSSSTWHHWNRRYGHVNEHNAWIPRDFWLAAWEKQAIVDFRTDHPLEGYRSLAFMMLDRDIVAVSPSSVYRVLSGAGLLRRWNQKVSQKGTGFTQPLHPHEHWHVDISYLNICGTFYYLCSLLDGCSRYIVHWEIRKSMTEGDVEVIMQRARERFPNVFPRIITDNGPQFIAKDFKTYIRMSGMTHVRTSPYYPQSNGKVERWHQTIKGECIRPGTPLSLEDAQRLVSRFVEYYNNERLHSAIGYIAPKDKLEGRETAICKERDRKLEEARQKRKLTRLKERAQTPRPKPQDNNDNQLRKTG